MTKPTPIEALQIIDAALGTLSASRDIHDKLQEAVAIVSDAIVSSDQQKNNPQD